MSRTPDAHRKLWRSLAALDGDTDLAQRVSKELPILEPDPATPDNLDRRRFLQVAAASTALAGMGPIAGCIRKPVEEILPFAKRPEDLIPGRPKFYASAMLAGSEVLGLLVENQDGRPTKIEGNPEAQGAAGTTNAYAQSSVWELYDPSRSKQILSAGVPSDLAAFDKALIELRKTWTASQGAGLGLLMDGTPSPLLWQQVEAFKKSFPKAQVFVDDTGLGRSSAEGLKLLSGEAYESVFALEKAQRIFALDCDFLGCDGDSVRNARGYAAGRNPEAGPMNRLYSAGPLVTLTSLAADHRLPIRAAQIPALLGSLAGALVKAGLVLPPEAAKWVASFSALAIDAQNPRQAKWPEWIAALAEDLMAAGGKVALLVGERQPAPVHALAAVLMRALGAEGRTVHYVPARAPLRAAGLKELAAAAGSLKSLVMLGANPLYTLPDAQGETLKAIPTRIHYGLYRDESAEGASWHLPATHFLEQWGDLLDRQGELLLQQPLIAPLYGALSAVELLALLRGETRDGHALWRKQWLNEAGGEAGLRRWIHDGLAPADGGVTQVPKAIESQPFALGALAAAWKALPALNNEGFELDLFLDASAYDGRHSANGWQQELPDPVTKMTWDNALLVGPATAKRLGISSAAKPRKGVHYGPVLRLELGGQSLKVPAFVQPGVADGVLALSLGYGRTQHSAVSDGAGVRAAALLTTPGQWTLQDVKITRLPEQRALATTQDHNSMEGRPIVRDGDLKTFQGDPNFAQKMVEHPPNESLWTRPNETKGQQWGLNIDLGTCIGCSACVVSCQSENNIPVVGKERVLRGREMHWIRLDRYYRGDPDDPEGLLQPMACQQCENAPCESVCPVGATSHSPDGLNDMAYNRCIGTRYCSNNCPYKVRRFNFFNYNDEISPVEAMQKNPDVTVRFRGVMEKCTYCVQRIEEARIDGKRKGESVITDGTITPACAQACPTQAITFGDISDPTSVVSKAKASPRNYAVLEELNVLPRTTYLARIRNPNPRLGS